MGDTLDDIKAAVPGASVRRIGPAVYVTNAAPKPLRIGGSEEVFDEYILLISEKHGLCKVMAIGRQFDTTVDGAEVMRRFNDLEEVLSAQYGRAARLDSIKMKSVWTGSSDWTMALLKKDRVLTSSWAAAVPEEGARNAMLPDSISAIELGTKAITTGTAALKLGFEFENAAECVGAAKSTAVGSVSSGVSPVSDERR